MHARTRERDRAWQIVLVCIYDFLLSVCMRACFEGWAGLVIRCVYSVIAIATVIPSEIYIYIYIYVLL